MFQHFRLHRIEVVECFVSEESTHRLGRSSEEMPAIVSPPVVIVFDNSDLARPYRLEAIYHKGERVVVRERGWNP